MTMFCDFLEREIEAHGENVVGDELLLSALKNTKSDKWSDLLGVVNYHDRDAFPNYPTGRSLKGYLGGPAGRYAAFQNQVFGDDYDLLHEVTENRGELNRYGYRDLFCGYALYFANLESGTSIVVINDPNGRCYRVGHKRQAVNMVRALFSSLLPTTEALCLDDPEELLDVVIKNASKILTLHLQMHQQERG